MKLIKDRTRKFIVLLLLLSASSFTPQLHAQLQNYEFGGGWHSIKVGTGSTDWHKQTNVIGGQARCHFSLIDAIINGAEHRFRAGDYLGAGFGSGYAKEQINPNGEIGGPDTRVMKTMWMTMDLQFGLQASYSFSDDFTLGVNAYKELQIVLIVMTDDANNGHAYNFVSGNARYGNFYGEFGYGMHWELDKAHDYSDHSMRMQFKYFTNYKEGKNIGLRVELANKKWATGRNDKLNSVEFCFGRMF
jgi:hypothetical protein